MGDSTSTISRQIKTDLLHQVGNDTQGKASMGNTTTIDRWLSPSQAAEIIPYSAWQIRKFCRQGLLPHAKPTGSRNSRIMIKHSDLLHFIQRGAA
ncbi:helix-turn-helix domain-containing protein [Corynebacterium diphtheriae]